MVDEGWTTVEKKGPKETGGKGGSSRQERSANGGGSGASRATRANQNVHYTKRGKLSHFFFFSLLLQIRNQIAQGSQTLTTCFLRRQRSYARGPHVSPKAATVFPTHLFARNESLPSFHEAR